MPEHYYLEVAGVLRRFEARQLVTPARATTAFSKLRTSQLRRVQVRPLLASAWAKRGHLTIADALYVVLAEQLSATLVTADFNLAQSPGLTVRTVTP